jgi:hypothetical protein
VVVAAVEGVSDNDISTNSGLLAGEFWPALQFKSKSLVVRTHALHSSPAFTVTFGNVATYSNILLLTPVSKSNSTVEVLIS